MTIPHHVVTHSATASHWQLRKQFPGKYHFTREHNGWRTHYYSDVPTVALSEAWREQVEEDIVSDVWALLDLHDEHTLFFMMVSGEVVREARTLPITEFNPIKLRLCGEFFITDRCERHPELPDLSAVRDLYEAIGPLEEHHMTPYTLKPNRMKTGLWVMSAVCAAVLGLTLMPSSQEQTQSAATTVDDEYQYYRQSVSQMLSASNVLTQAFLLTSVSAQAPSGWQFTQLVLNHHQLVANITRSDEGLMSTMEAWLAHHPQQSATLTLDALSISASVTDTLTDWTHLIAPSSQSRPVADTLIKLGWQLSAHQEHKAAHTNTQSATVERNDATLSDIASLITLFANQPVGIDALSLTPTKDGSYHIDMHLQFIGELE